MAKIRGISLIADLEYLQKKGVANKVLGNLDEKVKVVLQNLIPHEWHSYEEIARPLYRIIDTLVTKGNERFFIDMGKFEAMYGKKWYLKLFFKFASSAMIIKKFPALWNIYFDTGKIDIVKLEKKSATIRLTGIETTHLTDLVIEGWGEYAVEKTGGKNIKVAQTKCRERGDECTEWEMEWK